MGAGEDGGCTSGRSSGSGVGVVASAAFAFVRLDSLLGACVAVGGVGTVVVGATVLGTSVERARLVAEGVRAGAISRAVVAAAELPNCSESFSSACSQSQSLLTVLVPVSLLQLADISVMMPCR